MKLFDISQGKEIEKDGQTKTVWIKHGIGFQKEGKNIRIKLESLPIPDKDGEIWLNVFPNEGKDSADSKDPWGDNR